MLSMNPRAARKEPTQSHNPLKLFFQKNTSFLSIDAQDIPPPAFCKPLPSMVMERLEAIELIFFNHKLFGLDMFQQKSENRKCQGCKSCATGFECDSGADELFRCCKIRIPKISTNGISLLYQFRLKSTKVDLAQA